MLSASSLVFPSWAQVFIRHANAVLGVQTLAYIYRDIWPLATYTDLPLDRAEGSILWAKVIVLVIVGIFVPLFVPRVYVPYDPEVFHLAIITFLKLTILLEPYRTKFGTNLFNCIILLLHVPRSSRL